MDRRALTVDPNASAVQRAKPAWWKSLGPTQKPSPYATASWIYRRYSTFEFQEKPADRIPEVFDNWSDFSVNLYPTVLDGGLFNSPLTPEAIYDEGGFEGGSSGSEFIKHYFSTIKVYDFYASNPGQPLGIVPIDQFTVYDNSNDIQVPIPNPDQIYDSQLFAQWGQGEVLDELRYAIINGKQYRVKDVSSDTALSPNPDQATDSNELGKVLGQLEYEVIGSNLTITGWSHYNWQDATPVRKAFKSLINDLPECVRSVTVEDDPHSFWTQLGFISPYKGSDVLVYNEKILQPTPY